MSGILYGIGVGPGDPELMTLKAVRLIQENDVIAVPGKEPRKTTAYRIAVQAVPELAEKSLLAVDMPMVRDRKLMDQSHEKAADRIETVLESGSNVVFLTLGDPTVYSTYLYIQQKIAERGYQTALVSGVPSFCAAAARTNTPLAVWNEQIHIVPASHFLKEGLSHPGSYVLMKSGRKIGAVKDILKQSGRDVVMVENCGMEGEKIYYGADQIPDDAGYYSLIIARESEGE